MLDKLDLVLIMSVNPGFGGQSFIPEALNKLSLARARIDAVTARTGREIRLEVDGGVKVDNIGVDREGGRRHLRCGVGDIRRWGLHEDHRGPAGRCDGSLKDARLYRFHFLPAGRHSRLPVMIAAGQRFRVRAIAFDLDGTLLDTIHDLAIAINAMLDRWGKRRWRRTRSAP